MLGNLHERALLARVGVPPHEWRDFRRMFAADIGGTAPTLTSTSTVKSVVVGFLVLAV